MSGACCCVRRVLDEQKARVFARWSTKVEAEGGTAKLASVPSRQSPGTAEGTLSTCCVRAWARLAPTVACQRPVVWSIFLVGRCGPALSFFIYERLREEALAYPTLMDTFCAPVARKQRPLAD